MYMIACQHTTAVHDRLALAGTTGQQKHKLYKERHMAAVPAARHDPALVPIPTPLSHHCYST